MSKEGFVGVMHVATAACGNCYHSDDLQAWNQREAEKEARTLGWRSDKDYGWLCPNCRTAEQRNKPKVYDA